jgi:hypothetical protein
VIYEKSPADGGAGVNLDAGHPAGELGDETREKRDASLVERVRDAMKECRVKAGVTEENLDNAFGSRVFPEDCVDLFSDRCEHGLLPLCDVQNKKWMLFCP